MSRAQVNRAVRQTRNAASSSAASSRVRWAFTLVELLVVISVVALLMALLLPTLGAAQRRAQDARCRANLRQVGSAFLMYAQENKDLILPSADGAAIRWAANISKHGYLPPLVNLPVGIAPVPTVMNCPSIFPFGNASPFGDIPVMVEQVYGVFTYQTTAYPMYYRLSLLRRPDDTPWIVDSWRNGTKRQTFSVGQLSGDSMVHVRHDYSMNYFCPGGNVRNKAQWRANSTEWYKFGDGTATKLHFYDQSAVPRNDTNP